MIKSLKYCLLIPSFYITTIFSGMSLLYICRLLKYDEPSLQLLAILLLTLIVSIFSTIFYVKKYKDCTIKYQNSTTYMSKKYFWLFTLIGTIGLLLFFQDLIAALGGLEAFVVTVVLNILEIRKITGEETFRGIQLSYFSWIIISVIFSTPYSRKILYVVIGFVLIVLNLLFVDRTRPIWFLFTTFIIIYYNNVYKLKFSTFLKYVLLITASLFAVFLIFVSVTGKKVNEGEFGNTIIPPGLQDLYFYLTSGYAFLNKIILMDRGVDYIPVRTLYPLFKALSSLGITTEPPAQVLDFLNIGLDVPTNVGTFLEPYMNDGGYLYAFIGIFVNTFLLDSLGLYLLNGNTLLGKYAWANVVFVNFIGFFTPKICSVPIWLFVIIGITSFFIEKKKYKFIWKL